MPFLTTATIEVGAAIAKYILKLWLKDSNLGNSITTSLVDLLKAKTTDVIAQQNGRLQFEKIGLKVGESLQPLFESEGAGLDEGGRIAVAIAVAKAFNESKISSDLLAKHNLQPTELAHLVLSAHPNATRDFSAAEEALYDRIIKESCNYIVYIASQLPAFTERTFAVTTQVRSGSLK